MSGGDTRMVHPDCLAIPDVLFDPASRLADEVLGLYAALQAEAWKGGGEIPLPRAATTALALQRVVGGKHREIRRNLAELQRVDVVRLSTDRRGLPVLLVRGAGGAW